MGRLILLLTLVLILYAVLHLLIKDMPLRKRSPQREKGIEELVEDPFCQTYIPKQSAIHRRLSGKDYYFCSERCLKAYLDLRR